MPSLTIEEITKYSPFTTKHFVETGTYEGDTVAAVLPYFSTIHSVELQPDFAIRAAQRFNNQPKVKIVQGDSAVKLQEICTNFTEPVFFWLDGHWSGGNTARGSKDCPLFEELTQICKACKPKCIIAIDDARMFGTRGNEDWSEITPTNLLQIVESRLYTSRMFPSKLHPNDRMVIVLNERQ